MLIFVSLVWVKMDKNGKLKQELEKLHIYGFGSLNNVASAVLLECSLAIPWSTKHSSSQTTCIILVLNDVTVLWISKIKRKKKERTNKRNMRGVEERPFPETHKISDTPRCITPSIITEWLQEVEGSEVPQPNTCKAMVMAWVISLAFLYPLTFTSTLGYPWSVFSAIRAALN